MGTQLDHAFIADRLRLASGAWVKIREDTTARINSTIGHWRRDVGKRPRAFSARYEFRTESCGYGTGRSAILARHMPITFPTSDDADRHA